MKILSFASAIILSVVVLILYMAFLFTYRQGVRDLTDSEICKTSVTSNAFLRYDKISGKIDIKCPTLYVPSDSSKKNVVFQTLALSLADTWNEFLEGKSEIFDTTTDDYCVIRRVIEFKQANKFQGFFDYLLQNNPPNIGRPYFTYLTSISVDKGARTLRDNINLKQADVIDTSTPYAAVFVMAKTKNIGKVEGAEIGAGVLGGLATVGVIGSGVGIPLGATIIASGLATGSYGGFILGSSSAADWTSAMLLVPYNQESLNKLNCIKLPVGVTGKYEVVNK